MLIRIEFENLGSSETEETRSIFLSSPNGMCLSSSKAAPLRSNEMKELI